VLISESYRELNKLLHKANPGFGTSGQRYADVIRQLMEAFQSSDVLDYGAGKKTLEQALGFPIVNYDPCVPGIDAAPEPHDILACTDVLEHIEPDCLDDVLKDIRRCTKKVAFLLIATRPAVKVLADGRNAHLIQQPYSWWRAAIEECGFKIKQVNEGRGEFAVIAV
jgi:hypothetical protein